MISFTPAFNIFLKRYSILILLFVIVGNIIVLNSRKNKKNYFEYTIKAKVRNDFYDPTRTLFENIVQDSKDSSTNRLNLTVDEQRHLKGIEVSSYRNEDIYYVELNLFFSDTGSTGIITKVEQRIKASPFLKEKYFDRLERIGQVISGIDKATIIEGSSMTSPPSLEALNVRAQQQILLVHKDNLQRQFEIYFPESSDIHPMSNEGGSRYYIVATVIFFIIGFFVSIVIDQLRPKAV